MKTYKRLVIVGTVGVLFFASLHQGMAADPAGPGNPAAPGTPAVGSPGTPPPPATPAVPATPATSASPGASAGNEHLEKDPDSVRPDVSDEVRKMADQRKALHAAFVADQKKLLLDYKNATAQERDRLRQELKEKRQEFLAEQRLLRQEIKDRLEAMRADFQNNRDKILEEAKEKNQDKKRLRKGE